MWKNADVPRSDVPPVEESRWPRVVLHQIMLFVIVEVHIQINKSNITDEQQQKHLSTSD